MAGQKKDASTSILRRVLDQTPLRPAILDGFRSGTVISPAQFVARYFERNHGLLPRLLGGLTNLTRKPIGQRIIARYTTFHHSFGPIQRSLRPQPERRSRRRAQVGEDFNSYEAEDFSDFDYAQEPAYAQPNYQEPAYAQPNYNAVGQPGEMPWEGPLNPAPAQVARRMDFQPANLRYLTNPERQPEPAYRPENPALPPDYAFQAREIISPAASPVPTSPTDYRQSNDFASPASPEARPASPASLEAVASPDSFGAVRRVTSPDYREASFAAAPVLRPVVQPALSRAVQRTAEATLAQPTGAGNLGASLGASPVAVARRLALPNTVARYRALKQAADKVLLGEQPGPAAWEAEGGPYLEPALSQPESSPRDLRRAPQEANSLLETQRIQAAANTLLEAQRPGGGEASPLIEGQRLAQAPGQLPEIQRIREAAPTNPSNQVPEINLSNQVPKTELALPGNQGLFGKSDSQPAEATPVAMARVSQASPTLNPGETLAESRTLRLRSEAEAAPGSYQAENDPGSYFTRSEIAPALFNSAIPASLLSNDFMTGEAAPEVQRFAGDRPGAPVTTTAWANKLAALHNNPGVAASSSLARQAAEAASSAVWTSQGGPLVYAVQRRARRNDTTAAETQDRIFSLTENNSGLADFQPQWLKSMAVEEPTPLPANSNRITSPVSPLNPPAEQPARVDHSLTRLSDAPVISRPDPAFAVEQSVPAEPAAALRQGQPVEGPTSATGEAVPVSPQFSLTPRAIQPGNLQPTALQRAFKRVDFETPGNREESLGLDSGNPAFSYAARPGFRRNKAALDTPEISGENPSITAPYYEFDPADLAARAVETASSSKPLTGQITFEEISAAGAVETASSSESLRVQTPQSSVQGEVARITSPQYFENDLEAARVAPPNRPLVERLPGGSSALQRLQQAPGQQHSLLEFNLAAAAIDLAALRNNPGLSATLARTFEGLSGSSAEGGWSPNSPLSYVQRSRVSRPNQAAEFEGGIPAEDYQGFGPPLTAQNGLFLPDLAHPTPDLPTPLSQINRQASQASQPPLNRRQPVSQPGFSQTGANEETAARIQRNYTAAAEPGPSSTTAGSFTISGDWIAQLQSRFEGFSVGQLNGPTGLVMRRLLEADYSNPGLAAPDYGFIPGFNYAVPPLLWRKVSNYSPDDAMTASPARRFEQGPGYTSPGEVLRAFDREDPVLNRSEEELTPAERTTESASAARLDLPMLRQAHVLLQRIANLEKTNTSLELAHRMEAAGQAPDSSGSSLPGVTPAFKTMPGAVQRLNASNAGRESGEPASRDLAPAPLRMADAPVNRSAEVRFVEVDPEILEDAAVASPVSPLLDVRVRDHQEYATPLETAAARSSSSGPNIGQGEILQPLAIQRKAAAAGQTAAYAPLTQPSLHSVLQTSVGKTLDHPVQRRMTNIFGAHFNDVQVHTGAEAAAATRQVGAEAFTLGSNIYFAPGRYQPDTQAGQALIGHELTHVIQQASLPSLGNGRVPETSSLGQTLEHHAIANEQLLLRHLSNNQSDHDDHNHSFSSSDEGRLSLQENHFSPAYSAGSATIERSYQPVADQQYHPPINPSHPRNDNGSNSESDYTGDSSAVQRVRSDSGSTGSSSVVQRALTTSANSSVNVDDIIKNEEDMDELARKVYRIIRDKLMIERERGFGPSSKFF